MIEVFERLKAMKFWLLGLFFIFITSIAIHKLLCHIPKNALNQLSIIIAIAVAIAIAITISPFVLCVPFNVINIVKAFRLLLPPFW